MGIPVRVVGGEEGRGGRGALLEKGSPSPSRSPIPAENVYSGRYGTSPPPDARPAIPPDRERSGRGQADKEPQPVRQMVGRQQGTDGEAESRRGLKKEKRKTGRRGLLSAMPSHMKASRWGNRPKAGSLVRYSAGAAKRRGGWAGRIFFRQDKPAGRRAEREGRARHAGRHNLTESFWKGKRSTRGGTFLEKVSPPLRKKQPAKKPGDRHQGAGPRAGQAVRDRKKRFWKGEGADRKRPQAVPVTMRQLRAKTGGR